VRNGIRIVKLLLIAMVNVIAQTNVWAQCLILSSSFHDALHLAGHCFHRNASMMQVCPLHRHPAITDRIFITAVFTSDRKAPPQIMSTTTNHKRHNSQATRITSTRIHRHDSCYYAQRRLFQCRFASSPAAMCMMIHAQAATMGDTGLLLRSTGNAALQQHVWH